MTPRQRRIAFSYLFAVYLLCGMAETLISPLFPLVRDDLGLVEAQQATLLATVAACIAIFNVVGGALATRMADRHLVRIAAAILSVGLVVTGASVSFPMMLVGQALVGVAFGLFYPSGLASIARLYEAARGRAIANYGLAYSIGLAIAAVAADVGEASWRWVFYCSAIAAGGLVVWAPRWTEAGPDTEQHALFRQLRVYAQRREYRISGLVTITGLAMHFVVIGFAPVLYVDSGISLTLVSLLLAAGRLGSIPGKVLSGMLYDRYGGMWVARALLLAVLALGIPMLLLPGAAGLFAFVPFVAVSASVFPIANTLLVSALPPCSAWGIGTFRSVMLGASALLSGAVSLLLHYVSVPAVMLGALVVPALAAVVIHRVMGAAAAESGRSAVGEVLDGSGDVRAQEVSSKRRVAFGDSVPDG